MGQDQDDVVLVPTADADRNRIRGGAPAAG